MKSLIDKLKSVLIRSVGDSRICPHCSKSFTPKDSTAVDAFEVYKELFSFDSEAPNSDIELHRQALAQAKADNRSPEEIQFLQDGLDSHLQQEQKNDE